jgi:putative colanic acid biosynthesis acetyltransferase WcaF
MHLSQYSHSFSHKNKAGRLIWELANLLFLRPFPTRFFRKWRILVLKLFGAKIEWTSHVYASTKIWAPWNLELGEYSTLGPYVDCYNQGKITIGANTVISQKSYLCASTHDYTKIDFPLITKPITIGNCVWISADAFIGPGVIISDNAIVAARSVVVKNIEQNNICGGNPAKFIKIREFNF